MKKGKLNIHLLQKVHYFALKTFKPKRWWIPEEVIRQRGIFAQEGLCDITGSRKVSQQDLPGPDRPTLTLKNTDHMLAHQL